MEEDRALQSMNNRREDGRANIRCCQSIATKNQAALGRGELSANDEWSNFFSNLAPPSSHREAPRSGPSIFTFSSVSIEITLLAPKHLHSNSYPYNSGPHHVGTIPARH
jgi:hypothetical protein